jgi:hypothetical protein
VIFQVRHEAQNKGAPGPGPSTGAVTKGSLSSRSAQDVRGDVRSGVRGIRSLNGKQSSLLIMHHAVWIRAFHG